MVLFCPGISGLASFLSLQQADLPSRSSKHQSVREPVPFTLHEELLHQGAGKTAAPATRVTLATHGAPPLEICWSVSNENWSESVASSSSLSFHWELQSRAVSDQPSWIVRIIIMEMIILNINFLKYIMLLMQHLRRLCLTHSHEYFPLYFPLKILWFDIYIYNPLLLIFCI